MPDEATLTGAIISVLINLFPFLVLIGIWVYVGLRMMTQSRYLEEIMSETRRQNATLAALLTKINARLSELEAAARGEKKLDA